MPPKNAKKQQPSKKNKKQVEEDEFEKLLSELSKATKSVGMEKKRQQELEEKQRAEKERAHNAILEKRSTNEFEAALLRRQQQLKFQEILQQLMMAQRPFLDEPKTDVHTETDTSNSHFDAAVAEMQGWRANMEDAHVIDVNANNENEAVFCVFDGHSGKQAAQLCKQHFPGILRAKKGEDSNIDFEAAFLEMDTKLEKEVKDDSGCTAVTVHVTDKHVACGWVGDSRAVLCRNGAAVDLSHDHKPENERECERITAAGGFVKDNRVNGQLAMSRAMGDFTYKTQKNRPVQEQLVVPVPEVISVEREAGDEFVVLACDGIFDVLSNDELIEFIVSKRQEGGLDNKAIAEAVCRRCLAPPSELTPGQPSRPDGTDNMTIMIVDLK